MTRIKYFLVSFILGLAISSSLQCDYDECPNRQDPSNPFIHTMCKYYPDSYGEECNNVMTSGLTSEEIKEVLGRHNELRAKVAMGGESRGLYGGQPGGNIGPLAWDDNLAVVAQRWANQCHFDHDECRDINGIAVGQNLGYRSISDISEGNFSDKVTDWYDEVENFNHHYVSNYQLKREDPLTSHYTQLIWAKTTHVGCGGIKYETLEYKKIHLVCNYRPIGNMIGEAVYEIDKFGRHSPSGSDTRAPPFTHVPQFPKEHNEVFIGRPGEKASPYAHFYGSNKPRKVFPNKHFGEPPSETIPEYPDLLSKLPEKNHAKKSPPGFNNQFYNENTNQRPYLSANPRPNQVQTSYSGKCEYDQCEDKRYPGTYNQHTMCKYPTPTVSDTCGVVEKSQLDELEEQKILDLHNKFKQQALKEITSQGIRRDKRISYTGPLKWNHKLAESAQRWANQCIYYKDECRNMYGIEVGQIVAQMSNEHQFPAEFPDIVAVWFSVRNHDHHNRPESDYESKYYEQLVWANPTDVGCGGIKYIDRTNFYVTYLVCNYMTAEDITNKPVGELIRPPNYPPRENVPVHETSRPTDYKPASATQNSHQITVRFGSEKCKYQGCADLEIPGKYHIHTMCQYVSTDPAEKCHDVEKSSLDKEEKRKIIRIHNRIIRTVNRNARSLRWNDELEQIAQRWASQCRIGIDTCRTMLDGSPVRQHYGWLKSDYAMPSDFSNIIESWNRDVPFKSNLTEVGCGIVQYIEHKDMYNVYLVCNYNTPAMNNRRITNSVLQQSGFEL